MAKKKSTGKPTTAEAQFPYTTKPGSLRRLLKEIPKRPKPIKFDVPLLQSWGFRDANDHSMLRVLKSVRLLGGRNETTDLYAQFMNLEGGARVLGAEIKRVYAPLFTAAHRPFEEELDTLKNLFNIHSGGGDRTIELQMQTFKALCESASFDPMLASAGTSAGNAVGAALAPPGPATPSAGQPVVNINLHIHLPENKTRRDYTDIIEDIGRYIFGRSSGERRD